MRALAPLGIVIALLVFFIAYVFVGQPALHVTAWVVVISVATFFAAGGGVDGLTKALAGNLAGAIVVGIALAVWNAVAPGNILALSVILAVAAFVLCIEAAIPALSFIPAAFLGAGTWIGANGAGPFATGHTMVLVSMVIGALLGLVSQRAADQLGKAMAPRAVAGAAPGRS